MRMWNVNPKYLCKNHLLGEHKELHMLIGSINKGMNIKDSKYVTYGLVELHNIYNRHEELVNEFSNRNYNHKSPISKCSIVAGNINISDNIKELKHRCSKCNERINNYETTNSIT